MSATTDRARMIDTEQCGSTSDADERRQRAVNYLAESIGALASLAVSAARRNDMDENQFEIAMSSLAIALSLMDIDIHDAVDVALTKLEFIRR